jgi:predicted metal-dependent phosphoesterase TrpH
MFMADLHTHTNLSDGKMPMRDLVDLYGKRGFGAIAITDHLCETNTFLGVASRYLRCSLTEKNFGSYIDQVKSEAERAWREYRMLVIPGMEITKNFLSNQRSAHVLAVGVDRYIDPNLSVPELCAEIRKAGGLAIAAHPVSTRKREKQTFHLWSRREELRDSFDAWEVASGPHIFEEVLQSGLPMIATSDLHVPKQINAWKTVFRCEKTQAHLLEAVRKQELNFAYYGKSETAQVGIKQRLEVL